MHKRYANPNKFSKHDRAKAKKFMPQRKPFGRGHGRSGDEEDDLDPSMMECTECGKPIPVAQINQHKGICDECREKAEKENRKIMEAYEEHFNSNLDEHVAPLPDPDADDADDLYDPSDPNNMEEE